MSYAPSEPVVAHLTTHFAREAALRFQVEDFDTLEPGSLRWRVKGLWPAVGVCFVGGPSMSGKSFWTLDAMAKVCRGTEILGRKSVPSGVIYIASEGAHGVRNRIAGLRSKIGPLGSAFKFIGQAPNLTDPKDVAALRAALLEAKAELQEGGHDLGVVAVDTLSASIPGADENSAADMSPVLHALQELAVELAIIVIVVAHTGKDEGRGLRGWSGLLANADGLVMLEAPDGDTRGGTVVKVKDGAAGDRFAFVLSAVEIGIDDDGERVTTCVVEPAEVDGQRRVGRRERRLSPKQELVLRSVRLCLDDGLGQVVPVPEGIRPGEPAVHRDRVKERARLEGYADDTAKPESVRRKLNEHLTDLIGLERLRAHGEYLWLI